MFTKMEISLDSYAITVAGKLMMAVELQSDVPPITTTGRSLLFVINTGYSMEIPAGNDPIYCIFENKTVSPLRCAIAEFTDPNQNQQAIITKPKHATVRDPIATAIGNAILISAKKVFSRGLEHIRMVTMIKFKVKDIHGDVLTAPKQPQFTCPK